MGNKETVLLWC